MKSSRQLITDFENNHNIKLIEDGIVDPSRYHRSPFRILIISKSVKTNTQKRPITSLNKMLYNWMQLGDIYKYWRMTYNNLIVGLNAIINQEINTSVNDNLKILWHTAIISVDKSPGVTYKKPSSALKAFEMQRSIIKAQIIELKPNIIICAGTYALVEDLLDEIYLLSNFQKERIPETSRVFLRGDPLIIDYFHPKFCISTEEYARGLLFAYKYWNLLKHHQTSSNNFCKINRRISCQTH